MTKSLALSAAAAFALAAAPTLAAGDNPQPGLMMKLQIATQATTAPDALTDLPAPPRPAPYRANEGVRIAGPASRSPTPAAWHEAARVGDIAVARKSVGATPKTAIGPKSK